MVDEIDDETAMEIAIIENLQREDLSPLDEAAMYDRMIRDHGYSIRRLAEKLGKDKGYLENRLRLADAPPEIRQLVSLRKDTLSHAYELLKVEDPRKRRRLADQVARGELSLVKLRDKIEGRRGPPSATRTTTEQLPLVAGHGPGAGRGCRTRGRSDFGGHAAGGPIRDDSLVVGQAAARRRCGKPGRRCCRPRTSSARIGDVDRANLAKYLTIAKLRLENAIALVRRSLTRASAVAAIDSSPSGHRTGSFRASGRLRARRPPQRRNPAGAEDPDAGRLALPTPAPGRAGAARGPAPTPTMATTAPTTATSTTPQPLPPRRPSDTRPPRGPQPSAPRQRPRRCRAEPRRHGLGARRPVTLDVGERGSRPPGRRRPTAAAGSRSANAAGSVPAAPSHAKTGSSGTPTANGSHDQTVPLSRRS